MLLSVCRPTQTSSLHEWAVEVIQTCNLWTVTVTCERQLSDLVVLVAISQVFDARSRVRVLLQWSDVSVSVSGVRGNAHDPVQ